MPRSLVTRVFITCLHTHEIIKHMQESCGAHFNWDFVAISLYINVAFFALFEKTCWCGIWQQNGLSLDDVSCGQAMKLFTETKHLLQTNVSSIGNGTVHNNPSLIKLNLSSSLSVRFWCSIYLFQHEEAERYWFSFVLYCIKRLVDKHTDSEKKVTDSNGLTLCQILRKAKLKYITGLP